MSQRDTDTAPIECPLRITQQQYDAIAQCEAVVISEFEREEDGSRFGELIDWGDESEMHDVANTTTIIALPLGIRSLGKVVVPVSQLLPK